MSVDGSMRVSKNFLEDTYKNIQGFTFEMLQECSSWGVQKWYSACLLENM